MIFYDKDSKNKITTMTKSESMSDLLHLPFKCEDDGIEQAYDGQWYVKGYAPKDPVSDLEKQLQKLEKEYNMPRVIREGILSNPKSYSEFNVNRAKDLEELAKKIRELKNA